MKKITLFLAFSAFTLAVFATDDIPKSRSRIPKVYFYMNQGKLIESHDGKKKRVRRDVTLVNQTTIHPNGAIDASSGQSLQLKEGQYITLDGKIRNLKDMGRRRPAH